MSMFDWAWMRTSRNKARDMRHINQEIAAAAIGNFPKALKINDARIGRTASDNHLWLMFISEFLKLFIINLTIFGTNAVLHRIKPFARQIRR